MAILSQSHDFPHHLLTDERLATALDPQRLALIRDALLALDAPEAHTPLRSYFVPWDDAGVIERESVDFIFLQAVLQYPPDLEATYRAMDRWLTPGGALSHAIDFKCHGTTREWSGHWSCSDPVWSLLNGRRRDALNRAPHSTHIDVIAGLSCTIVCDQRAELPRRSPARNSHPASATSPTMISRSAAPSSRPASHDMSEPRYHSPARIRSSMRIA